MRFPGGIEITDWPTAQRYLRLGIAESISRVRSFMEKLDSASCIHVDLALPFEELQARIAALPKLNFVHVDHSAVSSDSADSLISLARKDAATKEKLVLLVNAGFHLYVVREGVSSMVRHRRIRTLWRDVIEGSILVDQNDIFHTLTPAEGAGEPRLLVVFSAVAATMYAPSLMRHFERNFATIGKYVPRNTHILRIADMGGVVGAFYLNSNALPQNEENIWARIEATARRLGVKQENIVLYGASKGGTAATFYALQHGVRGVAVDPILSDEHYEKVCQDLHFTKGTFPASKQARFSALAQSVHPQARLSLICSSRSPQFPYIEELMIQRFRDRFLFLNSENPAIKKHPDVGPQTIPHTLAQVNLHLAGVDAPGGLHIIW